MADFLCKLHHALDMGIITVSPSEGSLSGTHAVMRIGRVGKIGSTETLRYLLDSDQPPEEPALFEWSEDEENEGSWNLRARLSSEVVDAVGVGGWTYELSIAAADEQIWGESGTIRVAPSLPEDFDV